MRRVAFRDWLTALERFWAERVAVWSWSGGAVDTTVTFTLSPLGTDRTGFHMRQFGFSGLGAQFARLVLAGGCRRKYGVTLPAYLDQLAGRPTSIPTRHGGWHRLRHLTRRPNTEA